VIDHHPFDLDECQRILGLNFRDSAILLRALTHRSYVNEHPNEPSEDNERLEFLGDAVLDFIVGDWLYRRFPDVAEGKLTRLRAGLVRTETLAQLSLEAGIGKLLRLGRGEEENGGRERNNNLCAAFEAVNGAIYLDQGMDAVREYALPRLEPRLDVILREESDKDAKSRLQEWSQSMLNLTPAYKVTDMSGPEHARSFTVEVTIGTTRYGIGYGSSKRTAEQEAARGALIFIATEAEDNLVDDSDEDDQG
jgi:ribonuclease-3